MPRPLSETARQKAIDATLAIVSEGGIDRFTMDGVAKRSGVAKTTLYRHWDSSNDLLVNALDCKVEHIAVPDTGTLRGDLSALMGVMANIASQPGNRELILEVLGLAARDPEFFAVNEAMMAERKRPIRQVVERAVERGEIPAIDLDTATILVEGPLQARLVISSEPIGQDELSVFVNFVANGLGSK